MTLIIPPQTPGGGDPSFRDPRDKGNRGRLRHLLIGSPQRLRATTYHLQALRYIDHTRWTDLMHIDPEQGLIIRPTPGEMYTYLELLQWQD